MRLEEYKNLLFSHDNINNLTYVFPNTDKVISKSTKKVLILSKVNIENGAGGTRIQNLANCIVSDGTFNVSAYVFTDKTPKWSIFKENSNIKYVSLGNPSSIKNKIEKWKALFLNKKEYLKILKENNPDIVFIYSTLSYKAVRFVKKYCLKNKIKIYFDVVESRKIFQSLKPSRIFGYNIHNYLINHHYIDKSVSGVTCPTSYLSNFFKRKTDSVLTYPITMNVDELPKFNKNSKLDKITYLYAGNPKNKRDLLAEMIKGFNLLDENEKNNILLIIAGIDKEDLIKKESLSKEELKKSEKFTLYLGSISKERLYQLYPNIDYTILLKNPNKQYSKAGFPTKLSESFACGIPMIANISGDIGLYAENNENIILVKNFDKNEFSNSIKKSIIEYDSKHGFYSKNALQSAYKYFDNQIYNEKITSLLKNPK